MVLGLGESKKKTKKKNCLKVLSNSTIFQTLMAVKLIEAPWWRDKRLSCDVESWRKVICSNPGFAI